MELDPKTELRLRQLLDEHKDEASTRYAIKLIEKIVFYLIGAVGIAVLGAVLKLVIIP